MDSTLDESSVYVITTSRATPLAQEDRKLILPSQAEAVVADNINHHGALAYWNLQEPNDNGVLGGYGFLNTEDIRGSLEFYRRVRRKLEKWRIHVDTHLVADVGGGIGRVTKHLLLKLFTEVHLIEPVERMRGAVPAYLDDAEMLGRVRVFDATLESWHPGEALYDVIWLQWVCMFVPDNDLIAALRRYSQFLRANSGVIIIKDNVNSANSTIVDSVDTSSCRSEKTWLKIFDLAGLSLVASAGQRHWPSHLYSVQMFALIKSPRVESRVAWLRALSCAPRVE